MDGDSLMNKQPPDAAIERMAEAMYEAWSTHVYPPMPFQREVYLTALLALPDSIREATWAALAGDAIYNRDLIAFGEAALAGAAARVEALTCRYSEGWEGPQPDGNLIPIDAALAAIRDGRSPETGAKA
jgi:hypothetical protein